jgi:hypothetical protein
MTDNSIPEPMYRPLVDDKWPLILVGPIVRRVTETSVAVFVATSRECHVRLLLYDGTAPDAPLLAGWEQEEPTRVIGARLHAVVVECSRPANAALLTAGRVYGYDLIFVEVGENDQSLGGLDLLIDDPDNGVLALGYDAGWRPGFCLPGSRRTLRMIHGSCRKAHGDGLDLLPTVDKLIDQSRISGSGRPQQLFLTGDQIYADDVATGLLHTLREVGSHLLGWEEMFPLRDGSEIDRNDLAVDLVARSKFLADQLGKPETHYAVNHLLFLGEWLAMYAMSWSPVLWLLSTSGPMKYRFDLASSTYWPPPREGEADSTPAVLDMAELLPNTRRALANIATYMIFDDHDVTDDWFLNGLIDRRFRSVPGGRRMLRNALLAYAVFQDWGNKPEQYVAGTLGGELLDRIGGMSLLGTPALAEEPNCCDVILDVGEQPLPVADRAQRMRWDYDIVGPEHRVIFLDTRTWRYFPELDERVVGAAQVAAVLLAASPLGVAPGMVLWTAAQNVTEGWQKLNAGLISEEAMAFQIDERLNQQVERNRRVLFVVSAAPVFTFPMVDLMQRKLVQFAGTNTAKLREEGEEKWENEPWIGNHASFRSLLARLRDRLVIFLSGDVHYGYTFDNAFEDRTNGQSWSSRYIQLCASSARNSSSLNRLLTAIDWFTGLEGAVLVAEAATGYLIFPNKSVFPQESAFQSFHNEVREQFQAEVEHLQLAITNDEDYGPIAAALLDNRVRDAGSEAWKLAQAELKLKWWEFWNDFPNVFEFYLGDAFFAAPGDASQMYQIISLAMAHHYIPSLQEWSIANEYQYDNRGPARVVRPPGIRPEDWNEQAGPGVYSERVPYERLNFCSVGDTNIGVINFEVARDESGASRGYQLVHELLWYHDQSSLTEQPSWCTTRHAIDLFGDGPKPWSQAG